MGREDDKIHFLQNKTPTNLHLQANTKFSTFAKVDLSAAAETISNKNAADNAS